MLYKTCRHSNTRHINYSREVYGCGYHGYLLQHHFKVLKFGSDVNNVERMRESHRLRLVCCSNGQSSSVLFCMFALAQQREKKEAQMITNETTQPQVHHRSQSRPAFSALLLLLLFLHSYLPLQKDPDLHRVPGLSL